MKTIETLLEMLVCELETHSNEIISSESVRYYNDALGDTSFLLAGLLQQCLEQVNESDKSKWFDDSLLTGFQRDSEKLAIDGVMIWARDANAQWTDAFRFEIGLREGEFGEFRFYFADLNRPSISYERFRDKPYYWHVGEKDWKHVIDGKDVCVR